MTYLKFNSTILNRSAWSYIIQSPHIYFLSLVTNINNYHSLLILVKFSDQFFWNGYHQSRFANFSMQRCNTYYFWEKTTCEDFRYRHHANWISECLRANIVWHKIVIPRKSRPNPLYKRDCHLEQVALQLRTNSEILSRKDLILQQIVKRQHLKDCHQELKRVNMDMRGGKKKWCGIHYLIMRRSLRNLKILLLRFLWRWKKDGMETAPRTMVQEATIKRQEPGPLAPIKGNMGSLTGLGTHFDEVFFNLNISRSACEHTAVWHWR